MWPLQKRRDKDGAPASVELRRKGGPAPWKPAPPLELVLAGSHCNFLHTLDNWTSFYNLLTRLDYAEATVSARNLIRRRSSL
jgi:hypothetical protein